MGVDYRAVLAIGLEFEDANECVELLREHLTGEDLQSLEDEGDSYISEITYNHDKLPLVECLNCYSGYGWYVGFWVNVRDVERFSENVAEAIRKWNKMFPDTPAEIIHTVRIY